MLRAAFRGGMGGMPPLPLAALCSAMGVRGGGYAVGVMTSLPVTM